MKNNLTKFHIHFCDNMKKEKTNSEPFHESTKFKFLEEEIKGETPLYWTRIHFKSYPRFKRIKLPRKIKKRKAFINDVIKKRRSIRDFKKQKISLKTISELLYYSAGITFFGRNWNETHRAYPSAGARYPLELYPVLFNISGVKDGVYHYNIKEHSLELILEGNFSKTIKKYVGQKWIRNAGIILLISAVFDRTRVKYGDRGYRYVFLDAGHLTQNIYIMSTAMKLGCCTIGGFLDDKLNELLDIDGKKESVIYIAVIGVRKK